MTTSNGDMPAMPIPNDASGRPYVVDDYDMQNKNLAHGLTKREQFAMAAMQGILSNSYWNEHGEYTPKAVGKAAKEYADALLAELDKYGEQA